MKLRICCIIVIVALSLITLYLGLERREVLELQDNTYQERLQKNMDNMSNVVSHYLPETLDMYNNNFTEKELDLFKNSLGNVTLHLETRWTEIDGIERYYNKEHSLSQSIVTFSDLMFVVKENAGVLEEDVYYQISDIIQEYGEKFLHPYNSSLDNTFKESPKVFNEMTKEIQDLVELYIQ